MGRAGSGFDEGPLEIAVDVAAGSAVADVASRGDDARHEAGVAGQVLSTREAFDVADLQPENGSQYLAHAGERLQQLYLRAGGERAVDVLFEDHQLDVELVDGIQFERNHAGGLWRQVWECVGDISSPFDAEEIADACGVQTVAVDGRVDAVLERGAEIAQGHPGAQQLALVAEFSWRYPALGQSAVAQQDGESLGVERVGLVGLAHALLGLRRVGQVRLVSCLLHQVDDPVPVAGGLDGDLGAGGKSVEITLVGRDVVLDPNRRCGLAAFVDCDEDRVMLVGVTSEIDVCSSLRENVTHLAEATSAFMQSPAKNAMPNPATTTSGPDTTCRTWAASCRLIGLRKLSRFRMPNSTIPRA
jgi:hypothetical protein